MDRKVRVPIITYHATHIVTVRLQGVLIQNNEATDYAVSFSSACYKLIISFVCFEPNVCWIKGMSLEIMRESMEDLNLTFNLKSMFFIQWGVTYNIGDMCTKRIV